MKTLLLLVILLSCAYCVLDDYKTYCRRWRDGDTQCVKEVLEDNVFKSNLLSVYTRWSDDDQVASISYYLQTKPSDYVNNMFWNSTNTPFIPSTKTCDNFPETDVDGTYSILEKPIPSDIPRFKGYRIAAVLDLMLLMYRQHDNHFTSKFSYEMVRTALGRKASIEKIGSYLRSEGVCIREDYEKEVAEGRANAPTCRRYKITNLIDTGDISVCELATLVANSPVYTEFAVNPTAFMYYSRFSKAPLRKPFRRPNLAGIVTGYQASVEDPYWIIYVKRHGSRNNMIHLHLSKTHSNNYITTNTFQMIVSDEVYAECTKA